MTTFFSYLVVIVAVGALVYWFMLENEEAQLPSSDDLKKLTKANLIVLAEEYGIEVDTKKKKADLLADIESHR